MLRRRKIRATALRHRRRGEYYAEPHRQQTSYELESKSHQLHRLTFILTLILILVLVLIWIGVARIVRLHRLRQVRQCSEF
jgi:flagellar biogenesis protein FliO